MSALHDSFTHFPPSGHPPTRPAVAAVAGAGGYGARPYEALLDELSGFSPSRKRRLVRAALEKLDALEEMALQAAEAKLASGESEEEFRRELRSGGLSISSPASPELTPGPASVYAGQSRTISSTVASTSAWPPSGPTWLLATSAP